MGIPVVVPLGVVPQRGEGEGVHAALGCCLLIDILADGGTCLFCLYLYASGVHLGYKSVFVTDAKSERPLNHFLVRALLSRGRHLITGGLSNLAITARDLSGNEVAPPGLESAN